MKKEMFETEVEKRLWLLVNSTREKAPSGWKRVTKVRVTGSMMLRLSSPSESVVTADQHTRQPVQAELLSNRPRVLGRVPRSIIGLQLLDLWVEGGRGCRSPLKRG